MSELLFPEITETPAARTDVAVAAGQAIDLETVDLKKLALARFGDWPAITAATKADLARTALDLSNQTRVNEAKSLRERKINVPLATARATAKGLKSKLADTSKAVGAELEAIEAAWADVATAITPQIEAAQARIDEAARLEREREERRKAEIREHIVVIRGYLDRCQLQDMTAARVANGMAALSAVVIDKATYQEFLKDALQARDETLAGMQRLHDQLQEREAQAAEAERLRKIAEAQEAELAALRAEKAAREAKEAAAEPIRPDEPDAAPPPTAEELGAEPRDSVGADDGLMLQDMSRGLSVALATKPDAMKNAREAAAAIVRTTTDPVEIREAFEADDTPPEPKPRPMVTLVATPDMAERVLTSPLKLAQDLDHAHALLRDALALVDHATAAFSGRFPSQPKPDQAWWNELRERTGALQPKLLMTLAQKREAA